MDLTVSWPFPILRYFVMVGMITGSSVTSPSKHIGSCLIVGGGPDMSTKTMSSGSTLILSRTTLHWRFVPATNVSFFFVAAFEGDDLFGRVFFLCVSTLITFGSSLLRGDISLVLSFPVALRTNFSFSRLDSTFLFLEGEDDNCSTFGMLLTVLDKGISLSFCTLGCSLGFMAVAFSNPSVMMALALSSGQQSAASTALMCGEVSLRLSFVTKYVGKSSMGSPGPSIKKLQKDN